MPTNKLLTLVIKKFQIRADFNSINRELKDQNTIQNCLLVHESLSNNTAFRFSDFLIK